MYSTEKPTWSSAASSDLCGVLPLSLLCIVDSWPRVMQVAPAEWGVAKRMDCSATLSPSDAAETLRHQHSGAVLQLLSVPVLAQALVPIVLSGYEI